MSNKVKNLFLRTNYIPLNFLKFGCKILLLSLFALSVTAQTELVRVKVIEVHDGDTISVKDASKKNFKVRLIGIDAPELKQKFGEKSRKELKRILKRESANIVVKTFGLDRYNRILAQIFADKTDVGLELLQKGFVWFYDSSELTKSDWKLYQSAFIKAKDAKIGLFGDKKALNPKVFRRKKRAT